MPHPVDTRINELVVAHRAPVFRFVLPYVRGQHHTAEDIVQETMIRAWQHRDRLPDDADGLRRWLLTVAHRITIDHFRRQATRRTDTLEDYPVVVDDEVSSSVIAADSLTRALQALGCPHRRVINELFWQHRSAQEVATRLNIPLGTVRSRQHHAIRRLRQAVLG